jgi:hypothetical protein
MIAAKATVARFGLEPEPGPPPSQLRTGAIPVISVGASIIIVSDIKLLVGRQRLFVFEYFWFNQRYSQT